MEFDGGFALVGVGDAAGQQVSIIGEDVDAFAASGNFRPTRLEPIYRIARFYREHGQFGLAYQFSRLVTEVGYPEDILFVERAVYEHLLPVEHAACCFGTGRTEEGRRVCLQLLDRGRLPLDQIAEVEALLQRSLQAFTVGDDVRRPIPVGGTSGSVNTLPQEVPRTGGLAFVMPGWWEAA